MDFKKIIPPATQRQQGGSKRESGSAARQREYRTKTSKIQAIALPGTALEAFLRKYNRELLAHPPTPEVIRIQGHINALLALRDGRCDA